MSVELTGDEDLEGDRDLVRALCAIEDGMDGWQVKFVEDIAARVLEEFKTLTAKQRAKGEEILELHG